MVEHRWAAPASATEVTGVAGGSVVRMRDAQAAWQATPLRTGTVAAPRAGAPLHARVGRIRPVGSPPRAASAPAQ
jgi:hypothetical protein